MSDLLQHLREDAGKEFLSCLRESNPMPRAMAYLALLLAIGGGGTP
jgi:hypothetical protein